MDTHIERGSIVVGVDGSTDSERALHWAVQEAGRDRRPLAVVAAAGVDAVGALTWAGAAGTLVIPTEELVTRVRAIAETAADSVRIDHPEIDIVAHATPGDPREVLVRLSQAAHLVVVGSRGRGVLGSRFLGSVSTAVSRHASCPVVVCRPEAPGAVRRGVLVGADGTPEGHAVLDFAFDAAASQGLPLTVLHAFHDVLAAMNGPHLVAATKRELADERLLLAESLAGFREKYPDVRMDAKLARGLPEACLSVESQRWHLIVVGRHPTDSLSRALSSTVATAVVERAHTTVAVVPVPTEAV